MSSGVKTALIVAGVAGGVFVALKLVKSSPAAAARPSSSSSSSLTSLIQGFAPALASSFHSAFSSSSSPTPQFVTSVDTAGQQAYASSHGVLDVEGNQLIDLNTGNAAVYGPY